MGYRDLPTYSSKIGEKDCEFCRIPSWKFPLLVSHSVLTHRLTWNESEGCVDIQDLLKHESFSSNTLSVKTGSCSDNVQQLLLYKMKMIVVTQSTL